MRHHEAEIDTSTSQIRAEYERVVAALYRSAKADGRRIAPVSSVRADPPSMFAVLEVLTRDEFGDEHGIFGGAEAVRNRDDGRIEYRVWRRDGKPVTSEVER